MSTRDKNYWITGPEHAAALNALPTEEAERLLEAALEFQEATADEVECEGLELADEVIAKLQVTDPKLAKVMRSIVMQSVLLGAEVMAASTRRRQGMVYDRRALELTQ